MATQMHLMPLNCTLKMVKVDLMLHMFHVIFFKCYNFKKRRGNAPERSAAAPNTRPAGRCAGRPSRRPGDVVGSAPWEVTGLRLSCRFSHAGTCPEREAAALPGSQLPRPATRPPSCSGLA